MSKIVFSVSKFGILSLQLNENNHRCPQLAMFCQMPHLRLFTLISIEPWYSATKNITILSREETGQRRVIIKFFGHSFVWPVIYWLLLTRLYKNNLLFIHQALAETWGEEIHIIYGRTQLAVECCWQIRRFNRMIIRVVGSRACGKKCVCA